MQFGDIDNKSAPAVILDIDGVLIDDSNQPVLSGIKRFLRGKNLHAKICVDNYTVNFGILHVLDAFWQRDVSIYLFAHRGKEFVTPLTELFQGYGVPFTKLVVGGAWDRELLIARTEVKWYFFAKHEHGVTLTNRHKARHVQHWMEVTF